MKLTRINYKITLFRIFLYKKKCLITSKMSHLILQIARLSTKKHLLSHHKICAHKWICPDVSNFILRVIAAIRAVVGLGYGFSLHSHFGVRQFCGKVGTCGIGCKVKPYGSAGGISTPSVGGSILPLNLAFAAFASPCDCTKIVLTPN